MLIKSILYKLSFLLLFQYFFVFCDSEKAKKEEAVVDEFVTEYDGVTTLDELNNEIIQNPESPNVYLKRAYYYKNIYDFENALADVNRALKLAGDVAAVNYAKADILFIAGGVEQNVERYEQSEIYLNETLKIDSTFLEAHILLARLNIGKPNLEKAMLNVQAALKINEQYAPAYFWKGMIYEDLGNLDLAKQSYQTCIERDANYFDAYHHLGILLTHTLDKNAVVYFDKALEINPNSIEVLRNKGLYLKDVDKYDEAIECFNTILNLDPKFSESYYNIGVVYIAAYRDDMEQFSKDTTIQVAMENFEKAIQIDPQYPDALYNLGHLYKFKGDKKTAKNYFLQVLTIMPQHEMALEALQDM
jgi:tetratricopeptide (TPR) repeat protein